MKEPKPRTESLGKSGSKTRGVSQRKELAVVTLGMVAAITGVGGLLAASPPGGASEATADTGDETAAVVQPDPSPGDRWAPGRDETDTQVATQPVQGESARAPSWSAPSLQQAPARSRGS